MSDDRTRIMLMTAAFVIVFIFAALCLFGCRAEAYELPNHDLTPGSVNPALTKEVICSPTFRTGPYRKVTQAMHRSMYKSYGKDWNKEHACCEDDHLISIELGGSNDNSNRWPQPWPEARIKDKLENRLHKLVCEDKADLEEVRHAISTDWVGEYRKVIGPLP